MLEKLPPILEKLSGQIPGLSFVVGVVFLFLGTFDVPEFKSVAIRPIVAVVPMVCGIVFLFVAVGFYMLDVRKSKLEKARNSKPPGELVTDRLVFLLRHYHMFGVGNFEDFNRFAEVLYAYDRPDRPFPADAAEGWVKASDYAARYLSYIGLLDSKSPEYALNEKGRELLESKDFRASNTQSFAKALVPLLHS
jgi:hypothetical protein